MSDYDRAVELGGALQARLTEIGFPLSAPVEREIQRHVHDYADELKALGQPPERVIIAVKYAANQAGIHVTTQYLSTAWPLEGGDKLLVDMVGWCIEQYYGRTPRAP